VEAALEAFLRNARDLSTSRERAGKSFARAVVSELGELHMDRARFQVCRQELEEPGPSGLDQIRFEIAANPGEPMGPMNKVASGGELSRIMLAMHNVVSSRGNVGVYLFDEVDTGIGGKTAVTVGAKLQKVASNNQVICITHLPQVAAFADRHFHVEKSVQKKGGEERTVARVVPLSGAERELELARMLGGLGNDKEALANARAMLEKARKGGKPRATAPAKASKEKKALTGKTNGRR
jgi:DNA repair protein RecN (Recombination protein N)